MKKIHSCRRGHEMSLKSRIAISFGSALALCLSMLPAQAAPAPEPHPSPAEAEVTDADSERVLFEDDFTAGDGAQRSEEHTSELQSRGHLVCRLLLEKKNRHHSKRQEVLFETDYDT